MKLYGWFILLMRETKFDFFLVAVDYVGRVKSEATRSD